MSRTFDQKLSDWNKDKCPLHMESRKSNSLFLQGKTLVNYRKSAGIAALNVCI